MHLNAIKLRGFKSFPDAVELRLEPGVTVVVGPNGSGKSNVSDALVWAAGSLSPSELRAERPDDVLFSGAPGRGPASFCEVELLFDNSNGDGPLEFSELSVARRLHRGGEGQYLVNRTGVRRIDLVELLADVGLGGGMHSLIGQGRVEEVLGSSPQRRRELVEEAAGLGRFKRRRHRAELKLARVAVDVDRARDLETEVKGRLRPLALQATAAERAEKLAAELSAGRARIAQLDLAACDSRLAEGEERRTAAKLARARADERLEALLGERGRVEDELADAAGAREAATAALYRLRSAGERLVLRSENVGDLLASLGAELEEAERHAGTGSAVDFDGLERQAEEAAGQARRLASEHAALAEQVRLARARLGALERSLAEREGLPPAARALAEAGERLALSGLEVEPGYERAVAAALAWRAAALVAADPVAALALLERARTAGLGSLAVLVESETERPPPGGGQLSAHVTARAGGERALALLGGIVVVPLDGLLRARDAIAVTREGHGYDPARGELWFAGETAEAVLLELEARRRALVEEISGLEGAVLEASAGAEAAVGRSASAAAALARTARGRRAPQRDPAGLRRLIDLAERLEAGLAAATGSGARLEPSLRARVDAGTLRAGELGGELRRLGAAESEARRAAGEAAERMTSVEIEQARVESEAAEARRRLEAAGTDPGPGDDREALVAAAERLERRRETLGQVNPLAREEYARERERLDALVAQRADLEASLAELERLRTELDETVERRFTETFSAVALHFEEVATTLFPGGGGRLRLAEPAGDDEDGGSLGIEVELRPAGKRVARLSLLSGGEKALGAIAFLFALFLARPCPFYLLDEVEAALDDTNIARFVELLRRYRDRAQFIVITHQKRTMEAADILYGVTMGAEGVSQVVSRRVSREQSVETPALVPA